MYTKYEALISTTDVNQQRIHLFLKEIFLYKTGLKMHLLTFPLLMSLFMFRKEYFKIFSLSPFFFLI